VLPVTSILDFLSPCGVSTVVFNCTSALSAAEAVPWYFHTYQTASKIITVQRTRGGKHRRRPPSSNHHGLRRLHIVALLLECGPGGGLVGEDDSAAVHLPGAEQLRPPRPLPAASPRWRRRRWGSGRRRRATSGGARDGAPDGEVAILLRVVVEPRQLCNQNRLSRSVRGDEGRGLPLFPKGGGGEQEKR
jgi:hypothetical protein